jgi:hypothetical protein
MFGIVVLLMVAAACSGGNEEATGPEGSSSDVSSDTTGDGTGDAETDADAPSPEELGFSGPVTVVIPNSPGSISTSGAQRVMTAILGSGAQPFLGSADLPVTVAFDAVNTDDNGQAEGTYLTTSEAPLGLYVSYFEFPSPGLWEISLSSNGTEIGQTLFEVIDDSPIPTIGDEAPATDSLTGTTPEEIAAISTDQEPVTGFYDLSIADAITNDRPTVIAFVTPAFCQTALCGPTLETVKAATAGRDDLDVVHVEPFDLQLAPQGALVPIASMDDWGLQTEPWVFVVDADGTVAATFEGIIGLDELERALSAL